MVNVTLINDATGETIGVSQMPAEDLPESFAINTTLHLGDSDWSVVAAEPRHRADYSRSKTLTLRLRRIEKVDPRDLLFSLPSICDFIPGLGARPATGKELALSEDDWRQLELVSRSLAAEADGEIAAIRRIHEEESAGGVGWRSIHVREGPEPPIVGGRLTRGDVARVCGVPAFEGVTYHGAASQIEAGFSFTMPDGQRLYGVTPDGSTVTVLGVAQQSLPQPPEQSLAALETLAREFGLDLVHWCRCARAAPGDPLFRRLLVDNAAA